VWFPVVHVAVGIGVTYWTLARLVNHTTVRLSSGQLTIRHGPLPWAGGGTLSSGDLAQLYREEVLHRSRNGVRASYRLSAVLHDQSKRRLLTCDAADTALYVEQQVERYLGIADRRVAGEMPK
jgi:hypothetical protein